MRNMSFSLTKPQMRSKTKCVTRRVGWAFLSCGDVVMAVEKCQGLKKGEKVVRIGAIEIIRNDPEELRNITEADLEREGFPEMSREQFIAMFCRSHKGCTPETIVSRIEFRPLY